MGADILNEERYTVDRDIDTGIELYRTWVSLA